MMTQRQSKHMSRRNPERGADLADFMHFAAGFLTESNEAVFYHILGRFTLQLRRGVLICEYASKGVESMVGTYGPPTVEKIADVIEASYFRTDKGRAIAPNHMLRGAEK